MARNRVETCMFCGESPCACNKPEPKPRVQKVAKAKPEKPVVVQREVIQLSKRAPLRAAPKPVEVPDDGYDDAEQKRALTVLCRAGLMCADDIEKYKSDINMDQRAIRALVWRTRREETLHASAT